MGERLKIFLYEAFDSSVVKQIAGVLTGGVVGSDKPNGRLSDSLHAAIGSSFIGGIAGGVAGAVVGGDVASAEWGAAVGMGVGATVGGVATAVMHNLNKKRKLREDICTYLKMKGKSESDISDVTDESMKRYDKLRKSGHGCFIENAASIVYSDVTKMY